MWIPKLVKHIEDRGGLLLNIFRVRLILKKKVKVYTLFLWNEKFYVQLTSCGLKSLSKGQC